MAASGQPAPPWELFWLGGHEDQGLWKQVQIQQQGLSNCGLEAGTEGRGDGSKTHLVPGLYCTAG